MINTTSNLKSETSKRLAYCSTSLSCEGADSIANEYLRGVVMDIIDSSAGEVGFKGKQGQGSAVVRVAHEQFKYIALIGLGPVDKLATSSDWGLSPYQVKVQ
eukprot:jgi/Chrzof1/14382/Cz09g00220.t1